MAATKTISKGDVTLPNGSMLVGVEVRVANNLAQVFTNRELTMEMAIVGIYATTRNEYTITGADGTIWKVKASRRCCGG